MTSFFHRINELPWSDPIGPSDWPVCAGVTPLREGGVLAQAGRVEQNEREHRSVRSSLDGASSVDAYGLSCMLGPRGADPAARR
jgi:hypothetical protein